MAEKPVSCGLKNQMDLASGSVSSRLKARTDR